MLAIDMLPAGRGDCLWIGYGDGKRLLIDGGVPATGDLLRARIEAMAPEPCRFEVLVVTHIDLDHIGGILDLLRDPPPNLEIGDVWFNGWNHLQEEDLGILGAKQGEGLSYWIEKRGYAWNQAFGGGTAAVGEDGSLPVIDLDGLRVTLLSPMADRLRKLRKAWEKEIREAGLEPGAAETGAILEKVGKEDQEEEDEGILGSSLDLDLLANGIFKEDTSAANGSSLALLLDDGDCRCLLTGDAYSKDVAAAVRWLAEAEGEDRLEVDALKLSHHGGKKNTGGELIRSLACRRYLFSTDGSYYNHPDPESVARVILHGSHRGRPSLHFNHRSEQTGIWDDCDLRREHKYDPLYPADGEAGLRVEL